MRSRRWLSRSQKEAEVLSTSNKSVLKKWHAWSYMFVTWFSSQFTTGEDALDWAKGQFAEVENADITANSTSSGRTGLNRINAQLHVALLSVFRDDALTVIRNSLKGQGLDAWKRLCGEYQPSNEQSNLRLLRRVLQQKQQRLDNFRTVMSKLGTRREYRQCCSRTNDVLPDAVGSRCNPWHRKRCKNIWSFFRIVSQRIGWPRKKLIESYLDIKMPEASTAINVDAVSATGKGKSGAE